MSCIRCGRLAEENQVFCNACLEDMQKHPVKPDTPVHLPDRGERGSAKRATFQVAASRWEDRIFRLKYAIFWLIMLNILLLGVVIFGVCLWLGLLPQGVNDALGISALKDSMIALIQ